MAQGARWAGLSYALQRMMAQGARWAGLSYARSLVAHGLVAHVGARAPGPKPGAEIRRDPRASPVRNGRDTFATLQRLGVPARYTEFKGVGHGSVGPALVLGQHDGSPRHLTGTANGCRMPGMSAYAAVHGTAGAHGPPVSVDASTGSVELATNHAVPRLS